MNDDSAENRGHVPVLAERALEFLDVAPGAVIVDATVGLGGHASAIAERLGPTGRLIAIDQDPGMLECARSRVTGCRIEWVRSNFAELPAILNRLDVKTVDGVLADLGVSSPQLDLPERGFGFRRTGPLDMRMDPTRGEPAAGLIRRLSADSLARIFWEYGEERFSRRVARRIVEHREREPITTTTQLAEIIRAALPRPGQARRGKRDKRKPIDPATRVFQALRIAVNDELGALETLLERLPDRVRSGGRVVVISFHSLEDRLVKRAFRERETWQALTKKPCVADEQERNENPRARSAKLRAAQRV